MVQVRWMNLPVHKSLALESDTVDPYKAMHLTKEVRLFSQLRKISVLFQASMPQYTLPRKADLHEMYR